MANADREEQEHLLSWWAENLESALVLMAADAQTQIASFPPAAAIADELALDYNSALRGSTDLYRRASWTTR